MYAMYLDESGTYSLGRRLDPEFPGFCLCGSIVEDAYHDGVLTEMLNGLKGRHFNNTNIILHSASIRKHRGPFVILQDQDVRSAFYQDLNEVMGSIKYVLIASVIDVAAHEEIYGAWAGDPYELSLEFLMERFVYHLMRYSLGKGRLVAEARTPIQDKRIFRQYERIRTNGTRYVRAEVFQKYIAGFVFKRKENNVAGLQVADLCAYPIAVHELFPERSNPAFHIIYPAIAKDSRGNPYGWGIKRFP